MSELPDFITEGEGFVDVALSRPVKIGGTEVRAVRMREPTVADQLAADAAKGSEAAREIAMLANLAEVSLDDIKALTLRDYKRLQVALLGFIN